MSRCKRNNNKVLSYYLYEPPRLKSLPKMILLGSEIDRWKKIDLSREEKNWRYAYMKYGIFSTLGHMKYGMF